MSTPDHVSNHRPDSDLDKKYRRITKLARRVDPDAHPCRSPLRAASAEITRHLFFRLLQMEPFETSIEIGAHEASYSRQVRSRFPQSSCLALEANPDVHAQHVEALTRLGVDYAQIAAWHSDTPITFKIPETLNGHPFEAGPWIGSARDRTQGKVTAKEVNAQGRALDSLVADRGLKPPFVLWIDVEGAQREVLQGAENVLAQTNAVYIELESFAYWSGQMLADEVEDVLAKSGLVRVARDAEDVDQFNGVFVRDGYLDAEERRADISKYIRTLIGLVEIMAES